MKCRKCKVDLPDLYPTLTRVMYSSYNDNDAQIKQTALCLECYNRLEWFLFFDDRKGSVETWKNLKKDRRC